MPISRLMRKKWFPNPHNFKHAWQFSADDGSTSYACIYPLIMHDEALVARNLETNPENANFVEDSSPNCYPDSLIDSRHFSAQLQFSLTKGALETDKVKVLRVAFMPIFTAFKENLIAIDELTQVEVQDVLKLQSESTDRQCYPLWSGVKVTEPFANSALLHANVPGLTTNQKMETVVVSSTAMEVFYDAIQYYTIAGKLKSVVGGLKWFTLTPNNLHKIINIKLRSGVKRINPYTFFGVLVLVGTADDRFGWHLAGDTTAIPHLTIISSVRYLEWNENFNMEKV